ncbi:hypothetical protein HPT29_010045 [Microvirga terrae]|uniref:Uncharacterized protein n=1 Tax=Microvirga terrae TaxID=2740529 RepID=A0ABY5S068_9HYPH|nr:MULTISPECIES: hypothetical protein [Microvirga]MBQ0821775.1 hypothetical protein [Microvirga sp. HBU67558]UVF21427.1 hypothetical protein HPT29_010045 [Microvirga terrae]
MDRCTRYWARYMDAMALSRQARDPAERRALIRQAYIWLQRYFEAEERELARRYIVAAQR